MMSSAFELGRHDARMSPFSYVTRSGMTLGYCHEKLSLALHEMCTSSASLKTRLRNSLRYGFTCFPEGIFPDAIAQRLSEIKWAFAGVHPIVDAMNPPDALDRMRPHEVTRLAEKLMSLREAVAQEYYKQKFSRGHS